MNVRVYIPQKCVIYNNVVSLHFLSFKVNNFIRYVGMW